MTRSLKFRSNVMIGTILSLDNTLACGIILTFLLIIDKDPHERFLGAIILGSMMIAGWILFGVLYLALFRRVIYKFTETEIIKVKDGQSIFVIPWDKVISLKYDKFEWYMLLSLPGTDTANLIIQYRDSDIVKSIKINLFYAQVLQIKNMYYPQLIIK